MYLILDKDTIEMEIVPYIPTAQRGFPPTAPAVEIINAILYKLKTGAQWRLLPVNALFSTVVLSWQSVYYHYRKWCLSGWFADCWAKLLQRHKRNFDLSSVDLDGSHTPAIRGGRNVEYQGRKKRKTTNALYLTDRQGLPLAMSEPVAGNHNDLYNIGVQFEIVTATLEKADIPVEGLFLNADAGFDSESFRECCFKKEVQGNICFNKRNGDVDRYEYFGKELYDKRYAIERTNAWMDSYRSLLNRFDTTVESWKGFNYLAFMVNSIEKIYEKEINKSLNHFNIYLIKNRKMKNFIIIIIGLIFLLSCSKSGDENSRQNVSLSGQWKLIEVLNSEGGSQPTWRPIKNGYSYTFNNDGDFTSDRFKECTSGTYQLSKNNLILNYSCENFTTGIEEPSGTFIEEMKIENGKLILKPTYLQCIEGCGYKFEKIKTSK